LVDLGLLVGTDFNEGVKGIGPKKALALVRKHGDLEAIVSAEGLELGDFQEVRKIFLEPLVTEEYRMEWREPDVQGVKSFLCREFDFSEERVSGALEKMREAASERKQRSLDQFFG
jgi:flap endonuclease-1